MNKEPETYEELIRQRRCVDLTKHYELSMDDLQIIYEYLEKNPKGKITGDEDKITLTGEKAQNDTVEANLFILEDGFVLIWKDEYMYRLESENAEMFELIMIAESIE